MKSLIWRVLATLLLLGPLSVGAMADSAPPSHWAPDIDAFVAADRAHPPAPHGVLFIGSSSIQYWKSLAQDFPGIPVINRGFGGSALPDSTYYADRIVWPYKPSLIVMYAGDNDVNDGATADQVLASFQKFVARAREGVPGVPIVYISIKPSIARWKLIDAIRASNKLIKEYADKEDLLEYVDIDTPMIGPDGKPRADLLLKDGLHLNDAGYKLWTGLVMPYVKPAPA